MPKLRFKDREDAGQQLGAELRSYAKERPIIVALPSGGVPVAFEVARSLAAPLDAWVVKKIGVPWHPQMGVGAIAEGGQLSISRTLIDEIGLTGLELAQATETARKEVGDSVRWLRGDRPRISVRGRMVMLIDDGIDTGGTVLAAVEAIRSENPKLIVLAVPVASPAVLATVGPKVDRVVCLHTPATLHALGLWYDDFTHVPDEEVTRLLERARKFSAAGEPVLSHGLPLRPQLVR
jgi:putative phosphoribosyl transferase